MASKLLSAFSKPFKRGKGSKDKHHQRKNASPSTSVPPSPTGKAAADPQKEPVLQQAPTGNAVAQPQKEPVLQQTSAGKAVVEPQKDPVLQQAPAGKAVADPQKEPVLQPAPTAPAVSLLQPPALSISQRLWDDAYEGLANASDTSEIVEGYVKTLAKELHGQGNCDVATEMKDPTKRQMYMKKLVEDGLTKHSTLSKVSGGVGDFAGFILSAKEVVDFAVKCAPQAALPWAGVCIGLEILANPANATKSNIAGITHVVSRMNWYCALTEHLLNKDNIVVEQPSYEVILQRLEETIFGLYKAILLYQMKSVCSYYRNGGLVLLRGLTNWDDWDGDLKNVTSAEATLQEDSNQLSNQFTKDALGKLVDSTKGTQSVLRDIGQSLRDFQHMQMDEKNRLLHRQCLGELKASNPRYDKKRIEQTKGVLLEEPYRWVLDNHIFKRWCDEGWRDEGQSQLLWIKGDPGKGKTMLLCGIINELELHSTSNLSFFFCQADNSGINSATAVLRGLIFMLVTQQPLLFLHLQDQSQGGFEPFEGVNAWVALSEVFENILQKCERTYLIVDALDECLTEWASLLKLIVKTSNFPNVKWIVSSRNWPQIEERLDKRSVRLRLELNDESISSAVRIYTEHKVHDLDEQKDYGSEIKSAVLQHLTQNADNTFLWVALVCEELEKAPRRTTLKRLDAFPRGLSSLYGRMLSDVCDSDKDPDSELYKQVLSVMGLMRRPATLRELTSLIEDLADELESMEEIVGSCGSFITVRDSTVYFVHQSARDFLLTNPLGAIYPLGMGVVHHSISLRSLDTIQATLRRDMYGLVAPGFPIEEVKEPEPNPLAAAQYSCVYWIDHLCSSNSDESAAKGNDDLEEGGAVDNFLRQKFIYWLEALSLLRSMSEGVYLMEKLEECANSYSSPLIGLVQDARRFVLYNKVAIENNPLQAYVSALAFSPARSLIKALYEKELPDWIALKPDTEVDWSACLQTLEGHKGNVVSVASSHDGLRIASASVNGDVKIWDAKTGVCLNTLESFRGKCLTISHDCKQVALTAHNKAVAIWDASSGAYLKTLEGSYEVGSAAFSFNDKQIVSASDDGTIKIWDVSSGACLRMLESNSDWAMPSAFLYNGQLVALAGQNDRKTIRIRDVIRDACLMTLEGHSDWVSSVAISPNGLLIASGSRDKTVKVWDAYSGACLKTLESHSNAISSVAFSQDGQQIASGSIDQTAKIWDASNGACLKTLEGHRGAIYSVIFLPDCQLATGSRDTTVKIWDVSGCTSSGACSRMPEGKLERHSNYISSIAFSQDGKLVASGSGNGMAKVWDACSGACIKMLSDHRDTIYSIDFSYDGQLVATGSDLNVKIWDLHNGTCLKTLEGHRSYVWSVAFSFASSHDGQQLVASGSRDGIIMIWDASSGSCLKSLKGHSDIIMSLAFSQDKQQVSSGSNDGIVKIWNVCSGACLMTLDGLALVSSDGVGKSWYGNSVKSVAFSDNGHLVASASNGVVQIWNTSSGDCIQTLAVNHDVWSDTAGLYSTMPQYQGYALSTDRTWITWKDQNVLWLPQEYRPIELRLHAGTDADTMAFGCSGGRVFRFRFSTTKSPLSL